MIIGYISNAARMASAVVLTAFAFDSVALDKNGNFESLTEQDAFIAETLKKMARELNSQTPMQLDEETRVLSVIALQKTITFNMRFSNYASTQVEPSRVERAARSNLNNVACKTKATRDLIDLGVQYIYLYTGNDSKFITRVVIDKYKCFGEGR